MPSISPAAASEGSGTRRRWSACTSTPTACSNVLLRSKTRQKSCCSAVSEGEDRLPLLLPPAPELELELELSAWGFDSACTTRYSSAASRGVCVAADKFEAKRVRRQWSSDCGG